MPVEIRVPTVLRPSAEGKSSIKADGATIGEVFQDAVRQYPALAGQLVTAEGKLHKFVNVYKNDEDVRFLDHLDTEVSEKDVISVLPAVAGGA